MFNIKALPRIFRGYTPEKAQNTHIQCQTIYHIACISAPTAIIFAIINYSAGKTELAIMEVIATILLIPSFFIRNHTEYLPFLRNLLLANAFMTFLSLFYFGGIGLSGATWSLIVPFLVFLLAGLPIGWYWTIAYGVAMSLLILIHFEGYLQLPYDDDFLILFPLTFLFFSLVAAVLEAQLERLHLQYEELLLELELHLSFKSEELESAYYTLVNKTDEHEKALHALKQSEEKFEHAQRMEVLGTLVGGISHDFSNMLTGIIGNVFLAKRRLGEHNKALKQLDNIELLSNRGSDMIRQLLSFARKDSFKTETFSMNQFFKEALKLAQSAIPESIRVSSEICPEQMFILGDATQLQQLIMNLLNNARDALNSTPEPVIHCKLELFTAPPSFQEKHPDMTEKNYARITISDNGQGIPDEIQEKIFEPFFTTKEPTKGTGLGLSMLQNAVHRHHGIIELESTEGVGTSFHIYLPVKKQPSVITNQQANEIHQGNGETILLVDDDEHMRLATAKVLGTLGYDVIQAGDGEQGLETFRSMKQNIHLILTDLIMPKLGGLEFSQEVRSIDKNIPIIFTTGYDKNDDLDHASRVERSQIITKPFSFNDLTKLIQTSINAK